MRIQSIIVDDEKKSRNALQNLLTEFCPDVHIVAAASGMEEAMVMIQSQQPQLVFLDIEMQTGSGFDLLKRLGDFSFHVIFTTAYAQYAIKAIRYNAIDYLLKPIDVDELIAAVAKIKERIRADEVSEHTQNVLKSKILLSNSEGVYFVEIDDIIRCEADRAYTQFFLAKNRKILISKNIKEFEHLLPGNRFMRVHNSHIVNLLQVDVFIKSDGGKVQMKDGAVVPVSATRREEFWKRVNNNI